MFTRKGKEINLDDQNEKKKKLKMKGSTVTGLEPAIFGSEVRRLIR